jgi:hypothetical protein
MHTQSVRPFVQSSSYDAGFVKSRVEMYLLPSIVSKVYMKMQLQNAPKERQVRQG